LKNRVEAKYSIYDRSELGCKDNEEIKLRNEAMKRIAFLK
jgi:hypothetical protein